MSDDKPAIGTSDTPQWPVHRKLQTIQAALKAPKNQQGRFGSHRSAEGILEAVKPLLREHQLVLTLSDDIVEVGGRNYIKATAAVDDGTGRISATAMAWEGDVSRGLDASQVTGVASSYARKYALQGLFAIDDGKDADSKAFTSHDGATDRQRAEIFSLLKHLGVQPPTMKKYVSEKYSMKLDKLDVQGATDLLRMLRKDATRTMEPTS